MPDTPPLAPRPVIARDLLRPLQEALALLPNIKPRVARQVLSSLHARLADLMLADARADIVRETYVIEALPGLALDADDLPPVTGRHGEAPRLTPRQAAVLLDLYHADAFPLAKPRLGRGDPVALRAYAASEAALIEESAARAAASDAANAARARLIEAPATAPPSVLTSFGLVNAMFWRHVGPGEGTLVIAGRHVTKTLQRYASNSGRTTDWAVQFQWTEPDGTTRDLVRESRFAANRRNDAARDFGLPG